MTSDPAATRPILTAATARPYLKRTAADAPAAGAASPNIPTMAGANMAAAKATTINAIDRKVSPSPRSTHKAIESPGFSSWVSISWGSRIFPLTAAMTSAPGSVRG